MNYFIKHIYLLVIIANLGFYVINAEEINNRITNEKGVKEFNPRSGFEIWPAADDSYQIAVLNADKNKASKSKVKNKQLKNTEKPVSFFEKNSCCCETNRWTLRHIESKGVGYSKGYSTAEFFIAKDLSGASRFLFLDGRFHLFNDCYYAANLGLGVRFLGSSWVYGLNCYYDFRRTKNINYNQFSLGLEALGAKFDFRLNGYLPAGRTSKNLASFEFSHFQDHYIILSQKKEVAMRGLNAEIGYHFAKIKNCNLYTAAGPYYFNRYTQNAIGGKGRLSALINNI